MSMARFAKPAKLSLSCNACKQPCPAKDGDWHDSAGPDSQQVFLCRHCERKRRFGSSLSPASAIGRPTLRSATTTYR